MQNRQQEIEALRAAVAGVSYDDASKRLSAAIADEYGRPNDQTDVDFIEACEDILLAMDGSVSFVDREEAHRQELFRKVRAQKRKTAVRRRALGSVAAAAALMVLCVIGDSVFHWSGLVGRSVNREQAYQIGGMEIDPGLIASGTADGDFPAIILETGDLSEAENVLGFTPGLPTAIPDGYRFDRYTVKRDAASAQLTAIWENDAHQALGYFLETFRKVPEAVSAFASLNGTHAAVGGKDYVITDSDGRLSCTWQSSYAVYQLQGELTQTDILAIAASVEEAGEQSGCSSAMRLVTMDLQRASELMSFDIKTPTYVPQSFDFDSYHVLASPNSRQFSAMWFTPGNKYILGYDVTLLSDELLECVGGSGGYEQNCEGRYVNIDGVRYYIAYNCDQPFVIWTDGRLDCYISGPTTEEELLRMAVSVNGGDPLQILLNSVKQPIAIVTPGEAIGIARESLEEKYGVSLNGLEADYYMSRMSETHSDYQVEFRSDPTVMWSYAARVNAQTGEVIACVDEKHWNALSGTLLLELTDEQIELGIDPYSYDD